MNEYIGVEIGGTKQQIASFDENGKKIAIISEKVKLTRGAEDILDWIKAKLPSLVTGATKGIGVGFGGLVDSEKGSSACSVQVPGWEGFPIKTWFEQNFSLPATVVNDTVCGGYAELLYGSGVGSEIFYYTNIGTGCGGALFVRGKNYNGTGLGGAYMGQVHVPSWSGENGQTERMELMCSGASVERRIRSKGYIPENSLLYGMVGGKTENAGFPDLCKAARMGDEFALAEIDKWAGRYAVALADFITLFSPDTVSLGGGVMNAGDVVFEPIKRYTEELVFVSAKGRYKLVRCTTLDMAVILGSAMYARDGFITL